VISSAILFLRILSKGVNHRSLKVCDSQSSDYLAKLIMHIISHDSKVAAPTITITNNNNNQESKQRGGEK